MKRWMALAWGVLMVCVGSSGLVSVASAHDNVCHTLHLCRPDPPPAPPAPDPGGSEEPNQPVPAPGKPWGFNHDYQPNGDSTLDTSLDAMGALGVTHLRFGVSWQTWPTASATQPVPAELYTAPGDPNVGIGLRELDDKYLGLLARGITPVMILGNVPLWASTLYRCQDTAYRLTHMSKCLNDWQNGTHHMPAPEFYPQWRAWVTRMTERFSQAIIEGPNEPDLAWRRNYAERVPASQAAEVQCQLHQAVRSVDSTRKVLSMSMADASYERSYIPAARGCYDAFSFHPYPGGELDANQNVKLGEGSKLARLFRDLRGIRSSAGDTTPIWVTETGWSLIPKSNDPAFNSYWEERYSDAARRLYNRLATMGDVRAVMFHTLRDKPGPAYTKRTDLEYHFGFFRDDWTAKKRACHFLAMRGSSWSGCP
jgi:hypothetical protein